MKRIGILFLSSVLLILSDGCKKEELTHITDFEMNVHAAVNDYRVFKGLSEITLQYIMVDDAQSYSQKMARGQIDYGVDSIIMQSLNVLKTNLGGDATGAVVQFSEIDNADSIVNRMVRDPIKRQILEQNFNLTGVGSAKDADGHWYVTQLFIHMP